MRRRLQALALLAVLIIVVVVIAAAGGAWWTVLSPLLMSVLLLKVSGVTLLERTIGERRPDYAAYRARTNAFFPGPRRS